MNTEELIKYELPTWVEYIGIDWLQNIIGAYYGKKINRKLNRYNKRLKREKYIKDLLTPTPQ